MTEEVKASILGNMNYTTDLKALDLIVEAILENMDIEKSVFGELDSICKPKNHLYIQHFFSVYHRSLPRLDVLSSSVSALSSTPRLL